MTPFIVFCVVMVAVAIGLVVRPLLRVAPEDATASPPSRSAALVVAVTVPVLATWLYMTLSTWNWGNPAAVTSQEQQAVSPEIADMVARLEERLKNQPNDAEGWLMLGRSFVMMQRFPRAVDAFQQAYELTNGEDVSAITGLAEALILTDEASLNGRAGELIEAALARSPREPRALWYGALTALSTGNLELARDRMRLLLEQNPPEQVRSVLETQIADITVQLGGSPTKATSAAPAAASGPVVSVAVSLSPVIAARVKSPLSLFVLARQGEGGPPLAVVRLTSDQLPTTVELSDANAMLAGRGLSSVERVQIVARLSQSGSPQAASGDFFGQVDYVVQPGRASVNIVIDRIVP